MVILLHKLASWHPLSLVYTFSKFSQVRLYKPKRAHATRSSFYMVASHVQSQSTEALAKIEFWKRTWKVATFGTDEEYWQEIRVDTQEVTKVLEEFGPELIRMGRDVWNTQRKGLENAPFMKGGSKKTPENLVADIQHLKI